ncbi:MAG: permease-like cell division protein FtsX [Gammaproteobacteria bacterium]|nr:permease-like cell division protein FtsX [Gammaproteobacteria bacterium]
MSDNLHQHRPGIVARFTSWLLHHVQSLIFSLGKIYRSPGPTMMTVAVIGITLTLPSGFFLFLKNIENISGDFRSTSQITLYLKLDLSLDQAGKLSQSLLDNNNIVDTQLIPRDQALSEFKQYSGFGESIDQLNENPLPHTLIVQPIHTLDTFAIKTLLSQLQALPEVDIAKLDTEWLERLYTLIDMAKRAVIIISLLFSFAVLLIIGNTIRLDIQNRYQEIIVTKLIGATDAFIRRPFLYGGVWYGLFGGILSWLLVELSALALSGPFSRLNLLYQSEFKLITFSFADFLVLIVLSTLLGLAGSWLAVARHLNEIEPK